MEFLKRVLFGLAAAAVTALLVEAGRQDDGDLFLSRLALLAAMIVIAWLDDRLKELRDQAAEPQKKESDKD